jgi:rubrerythrin
MAKWVCSICGYAHEGDAPPDSCPTCKAFKTRFKEKAE